MKQYSVDRFEGDQVILVGEQDTLILSRKKFPKEIKEGTILFWNGKEYQIDEEASEQRRKQAAELIGNLFE